MRKTIKNIMILSLSTASFAYAGNSSSGGTGGIYEDDVNPWFLENTSIVSYCIEVDSEHFNLDFSKIQDIVKSSIDTWKTSFEKASNDKYSSGELVPFEQVRLATQRFTQQDCSSETLLRFQFGVLSEDQQKEFSLEPKHVVAEAVRSSYDRIHLRGKGFIYVAPGSGRLRPDSSDMAVDPWSFQDGILLKRVLLHELGHVFGIGHSGGPYDLMGAEHPEFIVQKSTIENFKRSSPQELVETVSRIGIFGYEFPTAREMCDSPGTIDLDTPNIFDLFFGIPASNHCRKIVFTGKNSFAVYAALNRGDSYRLIGKAKTASSSSATSMQRVITPVARVKLTSEQRVFQKIPNLAKLTGYLEGPGVIRKDISRTNYESLDGRRKDFIKTTFLPNQLLQMEVIWKNEIVELFDSGS